jgi:hypothetical protein
VVELVSRTDLWGPTLSRLETTEASPFIGWLATTPSFRANPFRFLYLQPLDEEHAALCQGLDEMRVGDLMDTSLLACRRGLRGTRKAVLDE